MKRFCIISLFLSLLLSVAAEAQTLSNRERREMNSCLLELLKEYERFASLHDDEAEHVFRSLFESEDAHVFCDVPGTSSYMDEMSVSDYVDLLRTHSHNTSVVIKDVSKGEFEYSEGRWTVPVHFRKELSYMDDAGYLFSIEEYHGDGAMITMHVVFDKSARQCRIRSVDGTMDSGRKFPEGRFVILNNDEYASDVEQEYYSSLTVGGMKPEYNRFGQAVLPAGEAIVEDPDVEVRSVLVSDASDNYDVMAYWFHMKNARFRLRASYSPCAYIVNGLDNKKTRSNSVELGLEFGMAYPMGRVSKISINSGVCMALSALHLNSDGMHQRVRYLDLSVPVYVEFEHRLRRPLFLVWNAGLKGYYEVKASQNHSKNPFDMAAIANLGVDVNLYQDKVYFMARGGYEYGLFKHSYADAPAGSLMQGASLRRGTVWISAGVKFKL